MTMTANEVTIGMDRHYGVHVTYLGDDGEQMLAFTAAPRRAIAAMAKQVRIDDGARLDDHYDVTRLRVVWMTFHDTCGCEHATPGECRADLNGPVTCCEPAEEDDVDPVQEVVDHDCPRWGLPPCSDEYGWVGSTTDVTAETPGAVQVCLVDQ